MEGDPNVERVGEGNKMGTINTVRVFVKAQHGLCLPFGFQRAIERRGGLGFWGFGGLGFSRCIVHACAEIDFNSFAP